jgi:hypothetical protein
VAQFQEGRVQVWVNGNNSTAAFLRNSALQFERLTDFAERSSRKIVAEKVIELSSAASAILTCFAQ